MSVETAYYTQKKDRTFVFSLVFIVGVILSTGGIYGGNWYLDNQNAELRNQVSISESAIKVLKEDKKVQIYDLIQANGNTLTSLKTNSQISKFIKHFKYLSAQYDITFKTFSYANGVIATTGLLSDNAKGLAYIKLANFISGYKEKTDRLFDIQFVNSVAGQDQLEVGLQFKVK